jgi:F-type H+-transporting ATPase subunit b
MKKINQKSEVRSQKLKSLKSMIFYSLPFSLLFFVFATVAFGSSGGEEEAAHVPIWKEYMWQVINFGILVFILFKFGRKPFQSFLKQRTELIEKTLNEAKEAKELARKALQEVEEKLKVKDQEMEKILSVAKRSGEEERERLSEEGDKLKEKILEQAKVNIEYEVKHAKEALKGEAVELAMELAEKKLKEKITKKEQEKLLEESLMQIGGKG